MSVPNSSDKQKNFNKIYFLFKQKTDMFNKYYILTG